LVAAIVVVALLTALVLVVWFAVLPGMQQPTKTTPSGIPATSVSTVPVSEPKALPAIMRVPDMLAKPSGWTSGTALPSPGDSTYHNVIDTGIGSIVILEAAEVVTAVDLDGPAVLWPAEMSWYLLTLDNGTGILVNDENELSYVDLRTGGMTLIGSLPAAIDGGHNWDDEILVINERLVLTVSFDYSDDPATTYCARSFTDLGVCLWEKRMQGCPPPVFGDGQWLNTEYGVLDVETGQPAPFGSDGDCSLVYYGGPADGVVRLEYHYAPKGGIDYRIVQSWDTVRDAPHGSAVHMESINSASWQSAWLLEPKYDDEGQATSLAAYSWQAGTQLWDAKLKPTAGGSWLKSCGRFVQMSVRVEESSDDRFSTAVIDGQVGKVVWQAKSSRSIGMAGNQVVYMLSYGSDTIHARDGLSDKFPELWSMKAPKSDALFMAATDRIFAISNDTSQLWLLQP